MSKASADKVISLLVKSIEEDTIAVRTLSSSMKFPDFCYLLFTLHVLRNRQAAESVTLDGDMSIAQASRALYQESLKYLIQTAVAYGSITEIPAEPHEYLEQRGTAIGDLIRHANRINSRHATLSVAELFRPYVFIQDDGRAKIDWKGGQADPEISPFYDYFYRLEFNNEIMKKPLRSADLVTRFNDSFDGVQDLFKRVFGTTPAAYTEFVSHLLDRVVSAFQSNAGDSSQAGIDITEPRWAVLWGQATTIPLNDVLDEFGPEIREVLGRLTFQPGEFDPSILEYHQVNRTPIIAFGQGEIVVCPELLLDSLNVNSHYSILESDSSTSEEYKARSSERFVDVVSEVCLRQGFREQTRGLELYDGKDALGDVDLVCTNTDGLQLLIEAKNHALPMSVYFKDPPATRDHLSYLMHAWEEPFDRRFQHLVHNHDQYGIASGFRYIIVSRFPEVLSHFSAHLAITRHELEYFLSDTTAYTTFDDVFEALYPDSISITESDLTGIVKDGLTALTRE